MSNPDHDELVAPAPEPTQQLSPEAKKRLLKNVVKVAEALASARKAKPNEDHFTTERLRKHGGPETSVIRRIVRDHRYALLLALKDVVKEQKIPRFKRVPFYEDGNVWL